jgi:hypothetical protein
MKKIFLFVSFFVVIFALWQMQEIVFAETSGSSPESGVRSRLGTAYDWLVAKGSNYGGTDAADWDSTTTYPWGTYWNRIMEAAAWEPDGTATEAQVLAGSTFYAGNNNRTIRTGTMTNRSGDTASSAQSANAGLNYFTALAGYYSGSDRVSATDAQIAALDSDLTAGNVKSGVNIFGVAGTASTYDSTNLAFQDYDDLRCSNNNGEGNTACAANDSEYTGEESTWTLKASGGTAQSVTDNSVTQTLVSNKVYQDARTGLYWSDKVVNGLDNEFSYVNGNDRTNPAGASCNFNTTGTANQYCDNRDPLNGYTEDNDVSANDFCLNLQVDADNADGDGNGATGTETDWRLPTQKELQQAYIDGSGNNVPNAENSFWSSTEYSSSQSYAWLVDPSYGYTYLNYKSSTYSVRCVRRGQL